MTIHYQGHGVTLHHGDCLDVLRTLPDASVDSVVTDPPYSLTDRREQYCAGDVLRDAIIMDAQHADAERTKSLVTLRITVAPSLAMRVRGVHLDRHVAAGEGQHVAREVFTADGIPFVRCSCTNAKSPTSFRWLTEHVPNGGVAELQAVIKRQADQA